MSEQSFPVWMTLQLGTDQPTDPAAELERQGFRVSPVARELLAKTVFAIQPMNIELVRATVADLGFPEGESIGPLFRRVAELGFSKCPAETAYRLRLALAKQSWHEEFRARLRFARPNQAKYEDFRIGMEHIQTLRDGPRVFSVDRDDEGRLLAAHHEHVQRHCSPNRIWVLARSAPCPA